MDKDYVVSKSNILINSSYNLSVEEQRIILILASLVEPSDEQFRSYKFTTRNFLDLLNVKTQTKYTELPKITKELMKKVFEIKEGKSIIQLSWLSSAKYTPGSGYIELEFSPHLKPFFLFLKECYTSYKLYNILSLKSKYSIRMYELLKSNQFKKNFIISIDDLKKLFKLDKNKSYNLYSNFKNRVLCPTQKEINQRTDIKFDFVQIKDGKKVTSLEFFINKNTNNENEREEYIKKLKSIEYKENEQHTTTDSNLPIDILSNLDEKIEALTGSKINYKTLCELYEKFGKEKIEFYINNFDKFNVTKKPIGFFVKAIQNNYELPETKKVGNISHSNYYDDIDFDQYITKDGDITVNLEKEENINVIQIDKFKR